MENIDALKSEISDAIEKASDLSGLEEIRIAELGKSGRVTGLMKGLGQMAPEDRKAAGQQFNELKQAWLGTLDW